MTPEARKFAQEIREALPNHSTVIEAARARRAAFAGWNIEILDEDFDAAVEDVRKSMTEVTILHRCSIVRERKPWYHGPREADHHWPALENYLSNSKGWGEDTIVSVNEQSSEIVSLLGDPQENQFRCRGLVVGYVQSGKTVNMTAVIAKAVDAGYNLVVVLGGVTNKLRAQTQGRLMEDVVERHRHRWFLYTTDEKDGDFTFPRNRSFTMPSETQVQLAVMKKEGSRLRAFLKTIQRTPPKILRGLRVLVIDDECDQASVNSSTREYDMTAINKIIREILAALPCVSYVGYTATPFANVFIDPFPHNQDELDDLYPADFITSLPLPEGYFGARDVFGAADPDADDGRDMVRIIPDGQLKDLQPQSLRDKASFQPRMAKSLVESFLWFLAACSVRRLRGQEDQHSSMLVHVSQYVAQHRQMAELLEAWFKSVRDDILDEATEIGRQFDAVFNRESANTGASATAAIPEGLEAVRSRLPEVVGALEFAVENGEAEDSLRLDYSGEPKIYVAIGGTVLARGLTLEGLVVSLFLRTSKQYDTLLQMGRWFGYRKGYDDLPRLWTTADLISKFRALATIEEEIREDIDVYRSSTGANPLSFAVRVRAIPGMAITSASKMRHALRTSISFQGQHVQTIRFDHGDLDALRGSWNAASRLVDSCLERNEPEVLGSNRLFRKIPQASVRRFLQDAHISDQHMALKKELLLGYLDKNEQDLQLWNLSIVGPVRGARSMEPLGSLGPVPLVTRARLKDNPDAFADIKALMSKQDVLVDSDRNPGSAAVRNWAEAKAARPQVPLLLIYPIDRDSEPRQGSLSTTRVPLDAAMDVIGFGIVFPGDKDRAGGYYAVDLDVPDVGDLDDEEDQIAEVDGPVAAQSDV